MLGDLPNVHFPTQVSPMSDGRSNSICNTIVDPKSLHTKINTINTQSNEELEGTF